MTGNQGHQATFASLARVLEQRFFQRSGEIRGLVLGLLARQHVLLLGPPGTGKSDLARTFAECFTGAQHFEWLLTKFTQPEELFGPVSVQGMKNDEFRRVPTGKLPEAHFAFLDEIFKANSAILNALLTAANERSWHNGPQVVQLPLHQIIGASNELPRDEHLAAFYDRFVLRYWVAPIAGQKDWVTLMTRSHAPAQLPQIDLADVVAAQAEVDAVTVPEATAEEAFRLRMELERSAGVSTSDRRWVKAFQLCRAAAWLAGETEVDSDTFDVLADVLWDEPDQRAEVRRVVGTAANPSLAQAQEVADLILEKINALPPPGAGDFEAKAAAVNHEAARAVKRIDALFKGVQSTKTKKKVGQIGKKVQAAARALREQLIGKDELDKVNF